jgi:transglutaminase-like putative cysteine protease
VTDPAVRYWISHRTTYRYGALMTGGHSLLHLVPRATGGQEVVSTVVRSEPEADEVATWLDAFDNLTTYLGVHHPHEMLEVATTSEVVVRDPRVPDGPGPAWEEVAPQLAIDVSADGLLARVCCVGSPLVEPDPGVAAYAAPSFPPGRPVVEALADLTSRIFSEFTFDPAFSDVSTPLREVLEHRRGVCQDFAHLAIGCLRSVGLPARYVSGYIETEPPPGEPKLVGADASHAWCASYLPGWGWLDLDPTNDQVAPAHHVTVAWGRDYHDVAPVRGVVVGPAAPQELSVAVDVGRV